MKRFLGLTFFILYMLICPVIVSAQQKTIIIAGRAIDERGAPLSNAIITLYYPPCSNCIDQILPVGYSLPDGVFFIEYSGTSAKGMKLFAQERVPSGFWSPLGDPPFRDLSHLPQFRGISIHPRRGITHVDVGDIQVKIRYSKVSIELAKLFGEKYKASREASELLIFILRDNRGKIIYDGWLPDVAFDPTFSTVNIALTKGSWSLDFSLKEQNTTIRAERLVINVKDEAGGGI